MFRKSKELRRMVVQLTEKNVVLQRANEKWAEEAKPSKSRLAELEAMTDGLRSEVSSLSEENSRIREEKEESNLKLATAYSQVDELKEVVANIELVSTKTQAELDFYQKELDTCEQELSNCKKQLEDEQKSRAELAQQFDLQAESIKAEAVAEFRRSDYFTDNLIKLQSSVMVIGQTYAIDSCSKVCPALDKEHPEIAELHNPEAEQIFETH